MCRLPSAMPSNAHRPPWTARHSSRRRTRHCGSSPMPLQSRVGHESEGSHASCVSKGPGHSFSECVQDPAERGGCCGIAIAAPLRGGRTADPWPSFRASWRSSRAHSEVSSPPCSGGRSSRSSAPSGPERRFGSRRLWHLPRPGPCRSLESSGRDWPPLSLASSRFLRGYPRGESASSGSYWPSSCRSSSDWSWWPNT